MTSLWKGSRNNASEPQCGCCKVWTMEYFGRPIPNDWLLRISYWYWCKHSKNKVSSPRKRWQRQAVLPLLSCCQGLIISWKPTRLLSCKALLEQFGKEALGWCTGCPEKNGINGDHTWNVCWVSKQDDLPRIHVCMDASQRDKQGKVSRQSTSCSVAW